MLYDNTLTSVLRRRDTDTIGFLYVCFRTITIVRVDSSIDRSVFFFFLMISLKRLGRTTSQLQVRTKGENVHDGCSLSGVERCFVVVHYEHVVYSKPFYFNNRSNLTVKFLYDKKKNKMLAIYNNRSCGIHRLCVHTQLVGLWRLRRIIQRLSSRRVNGERARISYDNDVRRVFSVGFPLFFFLKPDRSMIDPNCARYLLNVECAVCTISKTNVS